MNRISTVGILVLFCGLLTGFNIQAAPGDLAKIYYSNQWLTALQSDRSTIERDVRWPSPVKLKLAVEDFRRTGRFERSTLHELLSGLIDESGYACDPGTRERSIKFLAYLSGLADDSMFRELEKQGLDFLSRHFAEELGEMILRSSGKNMLFDARVPRFACRAPLQKVSDVVECFRTSRPLEPLVVITKGDCSVFTTIEAVILRETMWSMGYRDSLFVALAAPVIFRGLKGSLKQDEFDLQMASMEALLFLKPHSDVQQLLMRRDDVLIWYAQYVEQAQADNYYFWWMLAASAFFRGPNNMDLTSAEKFSNKALDLFKLKSDPVSKIANGLELAPVADPRWILDGALRSSGQTEKSQALQGALFSAYPKSRNDSTYYCKLIAHRFANCGIQFAWQPLALRYSQ